MKKTLVLSVVLLCAGVQAAAQTGAKVTRTIATSPRVISVGPRTTYLKEGLSAEEVVKLLGRPAEVWERGEGAAKVVGYVFARGEGRVLVAEFVNGRLARSRVETRADGLRAEFVNF